jgi:drug/metabolite transporter (DMT)-like permease
MNDRLKGFLLIIMGTVLWGAAGVVVQYLLQEKMFAAGWLTIIRLICGGAVLLTVDKMIYHSQLSSIWWSPYKKDIIIFSAFGMLMTQYTYICAISYSNAATATILQYLMPIVVLLYVLIVERRRPMIRESLCLIMALVGTFLLVTKVTFSRLAISQTALFWGLISAFAAAIYTLQPRKMLQKYHSSLVVGWGMFIGGVLLSFFQSPFAFQGIFDFKAAAGVLFVVICGTVISFWSYIESTKYLYPTEVAAMASIEPFSSVVLSVIFMNVIFGWPEIIGSILIVGTVFILAQK